MQKGIKDVLYIHVKQKMTTPDSVFLFKGINMVSPPGSIMSYMGNTNPPGWIVCNGQTVTVTDNSLQYLATILNSALYVSSNTSNSVTVPDLRGRFLQGRQTITGTSATAGNSTVTLTTNELPAHNHSVTNNGHKHKDRWLNSFNGTDVGYNGTYGSLGNTYHSFANEAIGITINNTGGGGHFPSFLRVTP